MDEQRIRRPRTVRRGVAVITATLAGALGAAALAAAPATPVGAAPAAEPVWRQVVERRALERVVELMPAGWPATEAMRAQAAEPLGDISQRGRGRRDVALMPPEWPATQVMRAALDRERGSLR